MAINTIKFSEFQPVNLSGPDNALVGIDAPSGGNNIKSAFVLTWTTAGRPATPPTGLLGYNITTSLPEYWDGSTWISLTTGSGAVNPGLINQIAWYAANGSVISGLTTQLNAILATDGAGVPSLVASTGTGAPVRANTPTLTTPILGVAQATSIRFPSVGANGLLDGNGNTVLQIATVATASQGFVIRGNTPFTSPIIPPYFGSFGTGTDIPMMFGTKGAGHIFFASNSGGLNGRDIMAEFIPVPVSTGFNYLSFGNAITAVSPILQAAGLDNDVGIRVRGKGAGVVDVAPGLTLNSGTTLETYANGTFTPTATGLTVVGTATISGIYTKIGRMVFVNITVSSTGSTSCTNGITNFTGMPFATNGTVIPVYTMNIANGANIGTGILNGGLVVFPPSWTTLAGVSLTFTYFATTN